MPSTPSRPSLNVRQEAFCRAFAAVPNGSAAAREAGYSPAYAAHQASKLLRHAGVMGRLAELRAHHAEQRAEDSRALVAKLEPVYQANLDIGDHDMVLQVVELQARIAGLVHGGATIRPRLTPTPGDDTESGHEAALFALGGAEEAGGEEGGGEEGGEL